jgi:PAS domain S-box-containing protein
MARLHDLTTRLATGTHLDALFQEILAAVTELQSTDMAALLLRDARTGDLWMAASTGLTDAARRLVQRLPAGRGASGQAVRERHTVSIEDVDADPRYEAVRPLARLAGYRAISSTPLISRTGDVLGAVTTLFREPGRPPERDIELVELYARQVANAIEHATEIERRQRAEQELQHSAHRFRATFESAHIGIAHVALDGRFLRVNRRMAEIFGYREDELRRKTIHELAHPEELESDQACRDRLLAGEIDNYSVERRYLHSSGRVVWVILRGSLLRYPGGAPDHFIAVAEDITERKRAEERMRQAEKLESIGLLAGGIAHDFNNILGAILGSASLALDHCREDHPARRMIETVVQSSERAAHLVLQMLAYAGKGRFVQAQLNLSTIILQASDLLTSEVPATIHVKFDLDPALPSIEGDAAHIEQAIINLVRNAAEAIGAGGGCIVVRTRAVQVECGCVRDFFGEEIRPGLYACLEVCDTGPGIATDVLPKIFDPFFSTRFIGRGLGLAAVAGIVRSHDGAILVRTAGGQGAAFELRFPARC